jgi:uncharacterized membrane protein YcaP (DUF421 family)
MFFESLQGLWTILITSLIVYAAFIIWLRLFGKRTLSKWNAFDFIVTIALGSIMATVILSKDIVILEGILASFLLIFFQFVITFLSSHVKYFDKIVKAEPTLLYFRGEYGEDRMKKQRVTKSEILSAIRDSGIGSMEMVEAVVLETDGTFSVIQRSEVSGGESALKDVDGYDEINDKN